MFRINVIEDKYSLHVVEDGYTIKVEQILLSEMIREYLVFNFNNRIVMMGE